MTFIPSSCLSKTPQFHIELMITSETKSVLTLREFVALIVGTGVFILAVFMVVINIMVTFY